jgi:AcrR family transcriptional regulator
VRNQQVAETRERIVKAGSELAHSYATWDWRELTFRAVAGRAGVGERTVYRHFPTERHLHDAVMKRLEEEAGVDYETVDLANLADVTARIFATLPSFAVRDSVRAPEDPTFEAVEQRRHAALLRAVAASAPHWTDAEQETAAGLLDIVWNLPSFERLVSGWGFDGDRATGAISWLLTLVIRAIEHDERPPV